MAERELDPAIKELLKLGPPIRVDGPGGLLQRADQLFHCVQGPPRAYFEYPADTLKPGEDYTLVRHVYDRLGYVIAGSKGEHGLLCELVVARLWLDLKWAYELMALHGFDRPILFWRSEPIVVPGTGTYGPAVKITCRLAIPGIEFPNAAKEGDPVRYLTEDECTTLRALVSPPEKASA